MKKSWAKLTQTQLDHLAKVIGEMEVKTSGEIRLLVVHSSAVTGHVFPLLWCTLSLFLFLVLHLSHLDLLLLELHASYFSTPWLLSYVLLGSLILAKALSGVDGIRRWFTSTADLERQVWARAEVEFHRERMNRTRAGTGILLMLSMMEHQAVVLADHGIAGKIPQSTWDEVIQKVLEGARNRRLAEKLEEALRVCGTLLSQHFPVQPDDTNELPNCVIVKE